MLDDARVRRFRMFFRRFFRMSGINYPWREPTTSPFHVLVAEMLLRQTDAPSVSSVWEALTLAVPGPQELLDLDRGELHRIIAPLGLAEQRMKALTECSQVIVTRNKGRVPRNPHRLLTLPHIGVYAAAAAACFAFDQRIPVVDGNVLRVFSRLAGVDFGRDNRRSEDVWRIAWAILPERGYRQHNFGLLDFAAQICTARAPKHERCELRSACACFRNGTC